MTVPLLDYVYVEHEPAPSLAPFVRCVWTLTAGGSRSAERAPQPVVPDGCVELVFNLADPFDRYGLEGRFMERQPLELLVGPSSKPTVILPTNDIDLIGVRLHPWAAAAFLGVPPAELRDRLPALDLLGLGLERSVDRLRERPTARARLAEITRRLESHVANRAPPDPSLRAAVQLLGGRQTAPSLREIASQLGKSVRWLQRTFERDVGLSPKTLARIARTQRALRLAERFRAPRWSTVAAEAGYFDHSHLVRDFRRIVGCTPTEFSTRGAALTKVFVQRAHAHERDLGRPHAWCAET